MNKSFINYRQAFIAWLALVFLAGVLFPTSLYLFAG